MKRVKLPGKGELFVVTLIEHKSYVDYNVEGIGVDDETSWTQMAKFHAEWSKKFYDVFVPLLQQWNELR